MSIRTEVRFVETLHKIQSIERKTSQTKNVVRGGRVDQIMCGQKYGQKSVKPLRIEKNKNGKTRSQNSILLDDREEFTLLILMTKITKKLSQMLGENWKDLWQRPCRAKGKLKQAPRRWLQSRKWHSKRFPKRCVAV